MKRILTLLVTMVALLGLSITAQAATYSSYWTEENGVWKVKDPNGNVVTNAWLCDDAVPENGKDVWYLLDANGNMLTYGIVQDKTGNYYSLEMEHNGYYGMLRYKSGTYDGVNLELESSHDGSFAAIKNEAGINALADKYGIVQIDIDNSNIVYTSSYGSTNTTSSTSDITDVSSVWPEGGYDEHGISYLAMEMYTNSRTKNKKYGELVVDGEHFNRKVYDENGNFKVYDENGQELLSYDEKDFDEMQPGCIGISYRNGLYVVYPCRSRDSHIENGKLVYSILQAGEIIGDDPVGNKLIFQYYKPGLKSAKEAKEYLENECNFHDFYYDEDDDCISITGRPILSVTNDFVPGSRYFENDIFDITWSFSDYYRGQIDEITVSEATLSTLW